MNLQADTSVIIPLTHSLFTLPRRGQIIALLAYIAKYFPGGVQTLSLGGQMREFRRGSLVSWVTFAHNNNGSGLESSDSATGWIEHVTYLGDAVISALVAMYRVVVKCYRPYAMPPGHACSAAESGPRYRSGQACSCDCTRERTSKSKLT
jgi:hypothetical protein